MSSSPSEVDRSAFLYPDRSASLSLQSLSRQEVLPLSSLLQTGVRPYPDRKSTGVRPCLSRQIMSKRPLPAASISGDVAASDDAPSSALQRAKKLDYFPSEPLKKSRHDYGEASPSGPSPMERAFTGADGVAGATMGTGGEVGTGAASSSAAYGGPGADFAGAAEGATAEPEGPTAGGPGRGHEEWVPPRRKEKRWRPAIPDSMRIMDIEGF